MLIRMSLKVGYYTVWESRVSISPWCFIWVHAHRWDQAESMTIEGLADFVRKGTDQTANGHESIVPARYLSCLSGGAASANTCRRALLQALHRGLNRGILTDDCKDAHEALIRRPTMEPLMEQLDWRDKIKTIGLETGPSVKGDIMIEAPADNVWKVISEEGNLKKCHPFCDQIEIIKWPGADAVDTITYYSGITYKRNFVGWEEGVGYDIELGDYPNLTSRVLWRILPKGENRCYFSIEVFPYLKAVLPEEKKRIYRARLFGDVLQHYLDCVVQGVRHKVETGEDVTKNQFGTNPHYSD